MPGMLSTPMLLNAACAGLPTVVQIKTRTPNPVWPRATPHENKEKRRARTKP